ncbi:uncharacterized protein LOC115369174 [Myripristis murdjan]|uniref:uncharacterized protein LOC115369174 n=1 Tax=Myripristis murdjan TaxID=586833 RepID=UPI00117649CB|nr:uncharacterized protein LOC115369174 [Myripristis murdjan]
MASGAPGVFGALVAVSVYTVFLSILGLRFKISEECLEYDTFLQRNTERLDITGRLSVNADKLCGYGGVALITWKSKAACKARSGATQRPDALGRILTICLLLSGDIHQCPGPAVLQTAKHQQSKPTISCSGCCPNCGKVVRANAKAVACDSCDVFVHIRCGNIAPKLYDRAVRNKSVIPLVCNQCCVREMCSADVLDDTVGLKVYDKDTVDGRDYDSLGLLNQKGLHFIHVNARSLLPKKDEIEHFASTSKAAVIAVSETWLDSSILDGEAGLTGYYIFRRDRNRHGGGVCLFIRSDITFNPRHDLQVDGLEAAWVELILPKTKPIIVGVCYRPPKQTDFYELLESVCCKSNVCLEKECIIMGDFNTDLLLPRSSLKESLSYLCKVSGLQQIISEPTRLSANSQSLLDLILVSDCGMISQSGVLDLAFSDHNVVFCTRKKMKFQPMNEHCSIKYRCTKQYTAEAFNQRLSVRDWSDVLEFYNKSRNRVRAAAAPGEALCSDQRPSSVLRQLTQPGAAVCRDSSGSK